jgi:carbon-monoxide dehydrogenase medium subunit
VLGDRMSQTETYMPESVDEVAALLLAADGQEYPVVTGTTLRTQTRAPDGLTPIIVDLARVPELNRLEYDERSGLLIGAAVPLTEPLRFPPVPRAYALLADGICLAGSAEVQARMTVGECLGNQAPNPDLALPLICLGASVAIFGPHGWSEMSVEALCAGRRGTALQPGEFIVGTRLPAPAARSGGAYVRWTPGRGEGEAAGAGAFLVMQEDLQTCCGARLSVWTEIAQSSRALDAERFLQGRRLDEGVMEEVGHMAAESASLPRLSQAVQDDRPMALCTVACEAIQRALDRARRK